jgi:hypothetical protein
MSLEKEAQAFISGRHKQFRAGLHEGVRNLQQYIVDNLTQHRRETRSTEELNRGADVGRTKCINAWYKKVKGPFGPSLLICCSNLFANFLL